MQPQKIRPGVMTLTSEEAAQLAAQAYVDAGADLLARVLTGIASEARQGLFYSEFLLTDNDINHVSYVCEELRKRGFSAKLRGPGRLMGTSPKIKVWWS